MSYMKFGLFAFYQCDGTVVLVAQYGVAFKRTLRLKPEVFRDKKKAANGGLKIYVNPENRH